MKKNINIFEATEQEYVVTTYSWSGSVDPDGKIRMMEIYVDDKKSISITIPVKNDNIKFTENGKKKEMGSIIISIMTDRIVTTLPDRIVTIDLDQCDPVDEVLYSICQEIHDKKVHDFVMDIADQRYSDIFDKINDVLKIKEEN